jgi:hypothetical protein
MSTVYLSLFVIKQGCERNGIGYLSICFFFTVALDKIDLFAQTSFFPTNGLLTILLFCYRDIMSVMPTVRERDLWSETFEL